MTSTSTQHSASDSPDSYERVSSPGINGILFHLLDFIYPANTSHSTASTAQSPSSYPPRKRTHMGKGLKSTFPHRARRSVQLQLSTISSNDFPRMVRHPYSTAISALSREPTSSTILKPSSSESASTPQITQAPRYEKVLQSQQAEKEYLGRKSNYSVGGKAMQLTSTSTKYRNPTIKPKS